jgi:hypothetical protein
MMPVLSWLFFTERGGFNAILRADSLTVGALPARHRGV